MISTALRKSILLGLGFAIGSSLGYGFIAQAGCTATQVIAAISPAYRAEKNLQDYKLARLVEDGQLMASRLADVHTMNNERREIFQDAETDDLDTRHRLQKLEDRFDQREQIWKLADTNRETTYNNKVATLERDAGNAAKLQSGIWAGLSLLIGGGGIGTVMKMLGQRWGRAEGTEQGLAQGRVEGVAIGTRPLALAKKKDSVLALALHNSQLREFQQAHLTPEQLAAVDQNKTA